ncbi:MAG: bifunctional diguanylate cyclase/phosphodiesterase [Acidimicrobiales bacterium]
MAIAIGDDLQNQPLPTPLAATTPSSNSTSQDADSTETKVTVTRSETMTKWIWTGFVVLSLLMVAYLISLLVRRPDQQWTWLDGWCICGVEAVASLMCIVRGLNKHPGRGAPLALGFGLLSWTIGDVFLTFESLGGKTPPTPSWADLFYIGFYPLAYIATVQILRKAMGRLSRPNWLDGVVAGLGAAAVCAAFAFHSIVHAAGGSALAAATNLTYPVGDLLLLSLVIGGTVLLSGRGATSWFLLAGGICLNVFGDTFNLFQNGILDSRIGTDVNAVAWPISIVLMSMSVWLKPRTLDPMREQRTAGFMLPSVAAVAGLAVLVAGTVHPVTRVALGLATATLVVVGIRLSLSARDLRLVTEERHRQAQTDELTGLGNRRHLLHVIDTYFTDFNDPWTAEHTLAFLYIDLNHFKEINDSFGHPAGDELLRQLGPRLMRAVPKTGSVFRLGGDELAVLLVDVDVEGAAKVAQDIIDEVVEPFFLQKMSASVGASIGIALAPQDATEGTGLMWSADTAMYRAKLGNTPYVFYDQDIDGGEQQLNLVEELRDAVEEGGFVLHYQPQLDLHSGQVIAVEALIRWPHPRLGLVPPLKFIPLAEDAGLMEALTTWVLGEAMAQCATWRASGRMLAVSVNVTTTNLLQEGFTDLIVELLKKNDLPGEALVIEITETTIIHDFAGCKAVIEKLRDFGVVVSIDDFGAGFTSLAYLSSLAVGELKLDREFITGLGDVDKERDLELVRATIQLGHDMRLRVVAEGIEDVETLELLSELGCDLAQGYYISRPMPAHKLAFMSSDPALAPVGAS